MAYTTSLGIEIDLKVNNDQPQDAISQIEQDIRVLKKDVKSLNKEFENTGAIDTLKQKLQNLAEQEKQAAALVDIWRNKYNQLRESGAKLAEQNAALKNLEKAKKRLDEIQTQIRNTEDLIEKLNSAAWRFGDAFEHAGQRLTAIGQQLGSLASTIAPLSNLARGFLTDGIEATKSYEQSLANLTRTLDSTGKTEFDFQRQVASLNKAIREMAMEIPASADEIADTVALMAQLGVEDGNLMKFSRVMIDLGNTTNLSAEQAGEAIAKFYNIMGGDMDTVDNFASALLTLGVRAAATESEITEMAFRLGAAGKRVGMTEQEVLALATALSSVGLEAQGGGSAISQVLNKIDMAIVNGGADLKVWADLVGMTSKQFKEAWSNDVTGTFNDVIVAMSKVMSEGGNLNEVFADLEIKNIRQIDALGRLAGKEDSISKYLGIANEAWAENSSLTEATSLIYGTLESQLAVTENTITEFKRQIGEALVPTLSKANEVIGTVVTAFTNLSTKNKQLIAGIAAITAALAPVLMVGSRIFTGLGKLSTAIGGFIKETIYPMITGASSLSLTVVAAVAAVIAIIGVLMATSEDFKNGIMNLISSVWDNGLKPVIEVFLKIAKQVYDAVKSRLIIIFGHLGDILAQRVIPIVQTLWDWFAKYIVPIMVSVANTAGVFLADALMILGDVIDFIITLVDVFWEGMNQLWDVISDTLPFKIFTSGLETAIGMIEAVIGWLKSAVDWFGNLFQKAADWLGISGRLNSSVQTADTIMAGGGGKQLARDHIYDSGGFGNIPITFNINNNGRDISMTDVRRWGKEIANVVDLELGRRLA